MFNAMNYLGFMLVGQTQQMLFKIYLLRRIFFTIEDKFIMICVKELQNNFYRQWNSLALKKIYIVKGKLLR